MTHFPSCPTALATTDPKNLKHTKQFPSLSTEIIQTHIVFEVVEVQEDCLYDVCGTGLLHYLSHSLFQLNLA